jgi:hypothetical protein
VDSGKEWVAAVKTSIPSGAARPVKSTVPPAVHGMLSGIFAKLAGKHAALAGANRPDRAVQPLGAPDRIATLAGKGKGLTRQPVIGSPDPANGPGY